MKLHEVTFKKAGKAPSGEQLYKCPICKNRYLEAGLNNHISQQAGKEAQYKMAQLVYDAILEGEDEELKDPRENLLIELNTNDVMHSCPHWKYLLDQGEPVLKKPVEKK